MPPPSILLSLLLLLSYGLFLSAEPSPIEPETRFSGQHSNRVSCSGCKVEHIAIVRPLPTEKLTPVYTMRVFSQGFGQTVGLPPETATYYGPDHCAWTRAVIEIAGYCNGTQLDRVAALWLSGVELIRTSTPQSGDAGTFWKVQKDITRYKYLLRQTNITVTAMLENAIDAVHYGFYWLDVTVKYYNVPFHCAPYDTDPFALPLIPINQDPKSQKLEDSTNKHQSLVLDECPADLIIPFASSGEKGFWFKILSGMDAVFEGITIPQNTYRAVMEVYVSPHGDDETWFANPPDSYIEMNALPSTRGHGSYREVMVRLDNNVVGSTIPFPVMYGGTINPLFWEPLAGIRAFDFPTYEIELTPFLGMLLDGRKHYFGLNVADAISYWLANANLHIWLDKTGEKVTAGAIKYSDPTTCIERESKFQQLEGKFDTEGQRKSEWSGWVASTYGNYTTQVNRKLEFENTIKFLSNGAEKEVKQKVEIETKVRVTKKSEGTISRLEVKKKFPLKYRTVDHDGSEQGSRMVMTKLEHSLEVSIQDRGFKGRLTDEQTCKGWMQVKGHDVVSGTASTEQRYKLDDRFGCYSKKIEAKGGFIENNATLLLCAAESAEVAL